jgi:hypothetical protein
MRSRAGCGSWACARATTEGTSATVTVRARRARSAIAEAAAIPAVSAEATAIAAVTTEAAAITAVATEAAAAITPVSAEAAAALWGRCGAFELELGCHGLATVLGNFERHALTLAEALRTGRCQCGDVYEHVRTTTIRKDKSEALGLIEPLYSSSLSHRKPLVLAQVIQ